MQVIHAPFSRRSMFRRSNMIFVRGIQWGIVALAVIGAFDLAGVNLFTPSTASVEPPVRTTLIAQPYEYFPSQFVNQATVIEEPIEQF